MEYNYDDIEKIIGFTSWSDSKKISELFRIDSWMYTNLGSDSTEKERASVERKSKRIYKEISKIDPMIGSELLRSIL
ncbi:MAG TPA: hypothetical protein DCY51_03525 [Bacteroidetes bacterium]|jgi:hypothetical protein|nr:hypothetical protein [Bacteroidota bacterium]